MTQKRDYYEVLEVGRTASAEELRKAYRRLARQHHPDMNGGDPAATERFKELNEAYEVLSDADRRARYDRLGHAGVSGNGGGGGADFGGGFGPFGDIFDLFFGERGGAEAGPQRGTDLRYDLEITFEEALSGVEREITIPRMEACEECRGSGARPGTRPDPCVVCAGTGYLRTARQTLFGTLSQVTDCYRCKGRGEIIADPCARCGGRGQERKTATIKVQVPPGADEGMRMRLTGQGEGAPAGGQSGDLYVFLHLRPHERFRRNGRDIICEVEVSFPRAALGGPIEVPTLEGAETFFMPEGTQSGDVFRLRGKGLPELGRAGLRGDQHVLVRVKTPTKLNERQRKLLQELATADGEDLHTFSAPPQQHHEGFFERIKNLFSHRDDDEAQGK